MFPTLVRKEISITPVASMQTTLVEIQHWPHWDDIQKVAEKEYHLTKQQFARLLPEYQRFMSLAKYYPHLGMCSDVVDKVWHAHFLYSPLYHAFCYEVVGRFIHHVPNLQLQTSDICSSTPCKTTCKTPPPSCTSVVHSDNESGPDFDTLYQIYFGDLSIVWNLSSFEIDGITV